MNDSSSSFLRWSTLCFFAWPISLALTGCAWSSESQDREALAEEFQQDFGVATPASAADFRLKIVRIGDSLSTWFSFKCDKVCFPQYYGHALGVLWYS